MRRVEIRRANPDEGDFVFHVRERSFRETIERSGGWDHEFQRSTHDRRFGSQDYWIVLVDDERAGSMSFEMDPEALALFQLFLLPEYQSQGVGEQCMGIVMRLAADRRVKVRLQVLKANARALAFYIRLGFYVVDATSSHDVMEWSPA